MLVLDSLVGLATWEFIRNYGIPVYVLDVFVCSG